MSDEEIRLNPSKSNRQVHTEDAEDTEVVNDEVLAYGHQNMNTENKRSLLTGPMPDWQSAYAWIRHGRVIRLNPPKSDHRNKKKT